MDPLSFAASVIAVATIATQVGSAFAKLRTLCIELPGRLHALSNEVSDLEIVLRQLAAVIEERSRLPPTAEVHNTVPQLVEQAKAKLTQIRAIIERLVESCTRRTVIVRAKAWHKHHGKLQALQDDVRTIKSSLNLALGASNSYVTPKILVSRFLGRIVTRILIFVRFDMMRVRLDLETLTTFPSKGSQDSDNIRSDVVNGFERHQEDIMAALTQNYHQVDERISNLEKMLSAQAVSIEETQFAKLGALYSTTPPRLRKRAPRRKSDDGPPLSPVRTEGLVVRGTQYINTGCQAGCVCACHSEGRASSPGLVDRVLGQLFVGYTGLPVVSPLCDVETCDKRQSAQISVEYWFPLGFCWSQIIRLELGYHPHLGPQMALSTLRRVPDSAQCVNYALEGNIAGLKGLFKNGLASPRDVSSTRGYSILRWALYGQQYETCKFLMAAGADPGYRPISVHDNSPSDKSCDIILRGNLSREVLEILRLMSQESDFVESQNFAPIHKIVLGLSLQDLEQEILKDPEAVDVLDGTGRSALEWAAARGDERAVVTLLSYGADPNIMDKNLNTPLTLASNQNHTGCVRLLVEAGALPDPPLPQAVKFGSPLNCAARNASDPLLLKTLLDFNANIEAMGVDKITPLLHVARSNSASHAMLLLEYGANINAVSKDGRTPLTTAISHNNHGVLRLLLDRWFEYSECPRLKGPHLLKLVAQYADHETIIILTTSAHLRMKYDKNYILDEAAALLKKRVDLNGKLLAAFEDLLDVLRHPDGPQKSRDNLLETGTLTLTRSMSNSSHDSELSRAFSITSLASEPAVGEDDDDSDQEFADAQESLALASDDIPIITIRRGTNDDMTLAPITSQLLI